MSRRLDAERIDLWRQLRHVARLVDTELDADLNSESSISVSTFEVLAYLEAHGGRARMRELSDVLVITQSTFTRLVDRMSADGFVNRELAETDGRGVVAVLTTRGRRQYLRARPVYRRGLQRIFNQHVTDSDLAALQRLLNKFE